MATKQVDDKLKSATELKFPGNVSAAYESEQGVGHDASAAGARLSNGLSNGADSI